MTNCTLNLTSTQHGSLIPATARFTDRFRFAEVQAAYGTQNWAEFFKLCDCVSAGLPVATLRRPARAPRACALGQDPPSPSPLWCFGALPRLSGVCDRATR